MACARWPLPRSLQRAGCSVGCRGFCSCGDQGQSRVNQPLCQVPMEFGALDVLLITEEERVVWSQNLGLKQVVVMMGECVAFA